METSSSALSRDRRRRCRSRSTSSRRELEALRGSRLLQVCQAACLRAIGTLDNLSVTGEAEVVRPVKSGSHDDGVEYVEV